MRAWTRHGLRPAAAQEIEAGGAGRRRSRRPSAATATLGAFLDPGALDDQRQRDRLVIGETNRRHPFAERGGFEVKHEFAGLFDPKRCRAGARTDGEIAGVRSVEAKAFDCESLVADVFDRDRGLSVGPDDLIAECRVRGLRLQRGLEDLRAGEGVGGVVGPPAISTLPSGRGAAAALSRATVSWVEPARAAA